MANQFDTLTFVCPSCQVYLEKNRSGWTCLHERYAFTAVNDIADFILPSRKVQVEEFLTLYQFIREKERWGSDDIQYYFDLPFRDMTNHHSGTWRIRAKTFECFFNDIKTNHRMPSNRVLDLGAGNCWLSLHLAREGYQVVAADINVDTIDGIGVAHRMRAAGAPAFICVRAEFDALPFPEGYFDLIIFNASLHYAKNPYDTLLQTLRYLSDGGAIYVLDSPIYTNSKDGEAMLREKITAFHKTFGIILSRASAGSYLTYGGIEQLQNSCSNKFLYPKYGLRWHLRPLATFLKSQRRPATFAILKIRNDVGH